MEGWKDSHMEAPNNHNIKKAINQYAYDLGIIKYPNENSINWW